MGKKEKIEKEVEPFWNDLVSVFFKFCRKEFGCEPSFDGGAPRHMKNIIRILKIRAEKKEVEWSRTEAMARWGAFLTLAAQDEFLHSAFVLSNLDRFKDKVFFNTITPRKDGTGKQGTNFSQRSFTAAKPKPTIRPKGGFGQL